MTRRRAFNSRVTRLVKAASGEGTLRSDVDPGITSRLLFGTDICDPRNELTLIDYLNQAVANGDLSTECYEKICYKNAERLLGIAL